MRNDLFFLKSITESNFRRPQFPFKVGFAITYRCNLRCATCNIWKKDQQNDELQLHEIEHFFDKVNKFSWVGLTGGEPFLREDLLSIVDIVVSRCQHLSVLHFASNGMLTEKIIDSIKLVRKKHKKIRIAFTVSIDGPSKLHDNIRGAKGVWDHAMHTFKALKQIPLVEPRIGFTLSHTNLRNFRQTLTSIKEFYPDIKLDDININIFQKSNFYYDNENLDDIDSRILHEEIVRILNMDKESFSIANFLRRTYLQLYLKHLDNKKCPLKCQALSSSFYLDPYGDIYPCSIYNKKLLNIRQVNGDFRSIWDSQEARRLAYECSHDLCPGCWSPCDANLSIAGSLRKALFINRRNICDVQ